jgi:hypothetical protein
MIKQLVDGLNHVSNADYHADRKYLSSSVLKVLYKDLADYKHQYLDGNTREMSNQNALDEGSLTHAVLLDPATLKTEFAFYDGLRKQGPEFQAFKDAVGSGKIIISKPQRMRVDSYVAACRRRKVAIEMLTGGEPEQTICGTLSGVPIKVRFDYINVALGEIYDIKTTADSADLEAFKITIEKYKYDLSAALYLAMAEQYYGKKFVFKFIVISKQDPPNCEVYKLSERSRARGQAMIDVAIAKYLTAKQNNVWAEQVTPEPQVTEPIFYEILEV